MIEQFYLFSEYLNHILSKTGIFILVLTVFSIIMINGFSIALHFFKDTIGINVNLLFLAFIAILGIYNNVWAGRIAAICYAIFVPIFLLRWIITHLTLFKISPHLYMLNAGLKILLFGVLLAMGMGLMYLVKYSEIWLIFKIILAFPLVFILYVLTAMFSR